MATGEVVQAFVNMIQALGGIPAAVLGFVVGLELVHFAADLVRGY